MSIGSVNGLMIQLGLKLDDSAGNSGYGRLFLSIPSFWWDEDAQVLIYSRQSVPDDSRCDDSWVVAERQSGGRGIWRVQFANSPHATGRRPSTDGASWEAS